MGSDEATLVGEYGRHVQVESSPVLSVPFDTDQPGCARCADADVQARIKEVRSSTLSPCAILLSEVGKHYHTFLKGTFRARIRASCHYAQSSDTLLLTVPFDLGRLMPAPMLAKPSSSIPTVLISYRNDSLKAIQWMISISQAFKFQLTTPAFTRRLDRSSPAMTAFIRVKC